MNSVEEVYNRLQKDKRNEHVKISISDDKKLIEITLSPIKYILATDDMVEINCRKKVFTLEYWTSTHWHPTTFEDLYEGLLKYLT